MTNPKQYAGTATPMEGTVPVSKTAVTKTPTDIKLAQLEEQLTSQHQIILKLKRDIARLKSDIGDIVDVVNNRG